MPLPFAPPRLPRNHLPSSYLSRAPLSEASCGYAEQVCPCAFALSTHVKGQPNLWTTQHELPYEHSMTPAEAEREIASGKLLCVYLVSGEERVLADRLIARIRAACLDGGIADFNEDRFTAGEVDVQKVISAARTGPMMAPRRFVIVRALDKWEGAARGEKLSPLDVLAEYAANPVPSTCLVLTADKVDTRRKLALAAKKGGYLVTCDRLDDNALARWADQAARDRGAKISPEAAQHLVRLVGPELAHVIDAIERLSLYVGQGGTIDDAVVSDLIVKVREADAFQLVGAVSRKDLSATLATLADVYDPRDRGLRLLGLLAWSVRSLIRFDAAIGAGLAPDEAAKSAGIPPFRARETAAQLKNLPRADLERWLTVLAETDLALKGSRRPPQAILESMLIDLAG